MATGSSSVNGTNEEARVSSSDGDLKLLRDAVRRLPPQPVKDLLSNGVCARCIFRIFSLHDQICSHFSVTTSILNTILHDLTESEGHGVDNSFRETKDLSDLESEQIEVCIVCLGILQFIYNDDMGMSVKKDFTPDFTAAIKDVVKQKGHQFDSFSLEVSIPQTVVENEQAVWSYIKEKYSSESWFLEKSPHESIATKDFLKLSVTNPLEVLLGVKSNVSSFKIRLTYTLSDASAKNQQIKENNGFYKRRKMDDSENLTKQSSCSKVEGHDLTRNSSVVGEDKGVGLFKFPLEKVNRCCFLIFQCYRTSIYIGGRYLKYSRNVSQTRWIIDDERMGEASVEEIVGGSILPLCRGDSYKFHAAGREDIDVRMLGTGRPFLVEIQNARQCPSDVLIKDMEKKINSLASKFVKVKNLKVLGTQGWDLMREGEAEKQKQYAALVWIPRPLNNDDVQILSSLKEMQILQKTPVRVLHRRSPLEREKTIHWMQIERIPGTSQYFLLHLCTQAGTYIKEFVHGDLGRTHPRAEILQLDVTDVKMDCFQD